MENPGTWHEKAHVATQGIKFECQRCKKCCKLAVILSYWDIENIRRFDKSSASPIITTFNPNYNKHGEVFALLHMGSSEEFGKVGQCAYLNGNMCRVYPSRPFTCITYPFSVELKKKMKDKRKLPKHAPTFMDANTSRSFVVVFDPDCPGIGKGNEVNLQEIASLEFTNISNFIKTYSTELQTKIPELICNKEDSEAMAKYAEELKVISYSFKLKPFASEENELNLYVHFGFNPADVNEQEARQLVEATTAIWKQSYPKTQGVFVNYVISKEGEMPQKMLPVYIGLRHIKENIDGVELVKTFRLLYNLDEARTVTGTSVVALRVKLENGKWSSP
jgi:Fe-S-cluster containining protein